MARGAIAKEKVYSKILELFPGSFQDGKIVRVPMEENGETIEIKVQLTAAKDLIGGQAATFSEPVTAKSAPTSEEKSLLQEYLEAQGLA